MGGKIREDIYITLNASGQFIGLPKGQIDNSEVGHTNVRAGTVVYQDLPKITKIIAENKLKDLQILKNCATKIKDNSAHIMGLLSDGGVHSHITHIIEVLKDKVKGYTT